MSWEGTRNTDPRFGIRTVPTALERTGDFIQSYTTNVLDYVVGGWELSGSYMFQSGPPVVFGSNYFFDGQD